jgi:alpha-galactosidase
MNRRAGCWIVVILAVTTVASCGGRAGKDAPVLQLQVQPVPGLYIQYDSLSSTFRLGNELIERRISADAETHRIFTTAFINRLSGRNYVRSLSEEFSFRANSAELSGVAGDFEYVNHEISGKGGVKELELTLRAEREEIGVLVVKLVYEIYSHVPVIRKWIKIENPGGSSVTIDSIQVESLSLLPGSEYDLEVYTSPQSPAGGIEALSPVVFDTRLIEGFLIGNEAPGVLKYSDLYSDNSFVSIGMKPYSENYATEIQLAPNEEFVSPAVFILLFKGDPDQAEEILAEFVAEYLAWSKTPKYSVWHGNMAADMTELEMRERAQLAAESGADILCWTGKRGDWSPRTRGTSENASLENFSQYVHDLGMKFGLSIELAVADPDSQILVEYPQWVVKLGDGSDYTIRDGGSRKMMCLGSDYTRYMSYEMDGLVKELDLDYIELTGPMIPYGETRGCFAEDHVHRSSAESLWYIYEGLFAICEYLHVRHPDLIIHISPKAYSPEGTIDYALLKYADVGWPF